LTNINKQTNNNNRKLFQSFTGRCRCCSFECRSFNFDIRQFDNKDCWTCMWYIL